ncbi:hypothetical protein KNZ16_01950 [Streptococcus dysgalactiae subsp. equisimilis]|uniref:ABC transporter permease subunit n=1 Tax=Streptococcus dysgalactiae TaxID=1334 RepID=UPI0012C6A1D8|nr:ATP-binding cassette domain-containing protein [Streptococcus dysgalactiae]GET83474.1 hypothetical protein KNZ16_01950 [Streptococcus dysgalactiae subsp. equisimilis]
MKKEHKALLAWIFILALVYLILTLLIGTDILGPYYVQILMGIGIAIIMAMGTNLVLGFSGQFPLGQAGFMAVGAYATAILTKYMPTYLGFYLSMLVGVLVAGLIAVIVGFPTLRLKGDYLAIATLGVAEIIRIAIINGGELTNGAAGLTVMENLEMGAFLSRNREQNQKNLRLIFDRFPRLEERKHQDAATLSGGEQQMLAMGRALMSQPKLLLLDEPSMGLAPLFIKEIFDIIQAIQRQGTTVLLIEQNANKALAIANRAYVLETGQLVLSGTGQELLTSEAVKKAYLGG